MNIEFPFDYLTSVSNRTFDVTRSYATLTLSSLLKLGSNVPLVYPLRAYAVSLAAGEFGSKLFVPSLSSSADRVLVHY